MLGRFFLLFLSFCICSSALAEVSNWMTHFQAPVSEIMERIISLYDLVLYVMVVIVLLVMLVIAYICVRFNAKANPIPSKFDNNVTLEIVWTVIPVLILVAIAFPSLCLLKDMQTVPRAEITIKVVGHQWYWSYEYPDNDNIGFDSYMIRDHELKPGQLRLLEVDNRLVIPKNTIVRFIVTAADVIHSFAVPAAGIKIDAIPGRINETWTSIKQEGVYYGQCSELCGAEHGFMPIAIEVVSRENFSKWIKAAKSKFTALDKTNAKIFTISN